MHVVGQDTVVVTKQCITLAASVFDWDIVSPVLDFKNSSQNLARKNVQKFTLA
jgi:hypothetical protein